MTKLEQLIQELCPNGVEFKMLGEIGNVSMCKRILKHETSEIGDVPFYKIGTFGKEANAFISFETYEKYKRLYSFPKKGEVLISASGTIGRTVIFDGEPAYFQDSNIVWISNDETQVTNLFLYYFYQTKPWQVSSGGTIARLYNDNILRTKIPVPPLEVQAEIVRILDKFTELTTELATELANRKKQYAYYREKLLNDYKHKAEIVKVSDLGSWQGGKTPSMQEKRFWENGTIPWISSKDVKTSELMDTEDHITEYALSESSMKLFPEETVVIVTRSGILKHTFPVAFVPFRTTVNQDIKVLSVKEGVLPRYAFHVLQAYGEDIRTKAKKQGGTVDSLEFQKVLDYEIPLPDYETQKRLVNVLDNFEAICSDLNIGLPAEIEARKKQYEYYRDKLLIFKKVNNN